VRVSTVAILGVAVAAGGFGAYKLGHGAANTAREVSTLAVGIPQQAAVAAAEANLAGAVSAASAYQAEHGGYAGMSTAALHGYNGITGAVSVASATAAAYCIETTVGVTTVSIRGPDGTYVVGRC
jgi:hypothetical protein